MSALKRTASAGLVLEDALTLEDIANRVVKEDFSFFLPLEYGVLDLPRVDLNQEQKTEISFGRFIELDSQEPLLAAFYGDAVQAILERRGHLYKPRKVLV